MRFVDEFRDPAAARALVKSITELAGDDEFKFMEVCGGHTHTIYRHGIEHLLPEQRRAGARPRLPGVRDPDGPRRRRDVAGRTARSHLHDVRRHDARARIATATCIEAKARGADVRFVYSPLDALKVAVDNPDRQVVFFAVGFETTAPSTAVTLVRARGTRASRTSACSATTSRSSRRSRRSSNRPTCGSTGFLGPGHVSTVVGQRPYRFVPEVYGKPMVVGRVRAAGHPRLGAHAAAADPRRPLRGREPVHPGGARRGQHRRR